MSALDVRALATTVAGDGETCAVLLHGIGGGRNLWSGPGGGVVAPLVAGGLRVVALDFPGYGDSQGAGLPTMIHLVAAARAVVQQAVASHRVVLVGHSMGGLVAQQLLAEDARGLAAAVLACTSDAFGPAQGDWQARFVAERVAPLDQGLGMAGVATQLVPAMVAPGAVPGAAEHAAAVMAAVPEASYRVALQAVAGFQGRAALTRLAVPALMLAAQQDRTAPPALMQRMARSAPQGRYAELSDAGHIAPAEQPLAFARAVLAFTATLG